MVVFVTLLRREEAKGSFFFFFFRECTHVLLSTIGGKDTGRQWGQQQTETNGRPGGEQGIRVGGILRAGGTFIFELLLRQHPVLNGWG